MAGGDGGGAQTCGPIALLIAPLWCARAMCMRSPRGVPQRCCDMFSLRPTVVRGNASEVLALGGAAGAATKVRACARGFHGGLHSFKGGGPGPRGEGMRVVQVASWVSSPRKPVDEQGVDSTATSDEALSTALQLARASGAVVAVSGATDLVSGAGLGMGEALVWVICCWACTNHLPPRRRVRHTRTSHTHKQTTHPTPQVTDGASIWAVSNGVEMLTLITAAGCSVTAIVAAFVAANRGRVCGRNHVPAGLAVAAALSVFGLAAEVAARSAQGPGSLRVGLLDQLHGLGRECVVAGARITRRAAPPPPST